MRPLPPFNARPAKSKREKAKMLKRKAAKRKSPRKIEKGLSLSARLTKPKAKAKAAGLKKPALKIIGVKGAC